MTEKARCVKCGCALAYAVPGAACWDCHQAKEVVDYERGLGRLARMARKKAKSDRDARKRGL